MSDLDETNVSAMILSLLTSRGTDATLCPSEVARTLAGQGAVEDWRTAMPGVHAAVDSLLLAGAVRISWKGERLEARRGPYRIALDLPHKGRPGG